MSRDTGSDSIGTPDGPLPTEDIRSLAGVPDGFDRLRTPYRMACIRGEGRSADASDVGCPFCTAPDKNNQARLIIYRGGSCSVLTNLFPCNPGYLLVYSYYHVSDYVELTDEERVELGNLTVTAMCITCEVTSPAGFSLDIDQGEAASADTTAHPHQHVVPHWSGDANFLPTITQTEAMSELLEDARARLVAA